ncbi:MAG: TonB-dependent receptor [Lewinellaceae bacterium]|nr:TonB-dependent receptor [Lewinellaceae bacterium]
MKKTILFIGTLFCLVSLSAQSAARVKVKDAQTGLPLPYVTIFSTNPSLQAVTDETGQADLQAFSSAAAIQFVYLGYEPHTSSYQEVVAQGFVVSLEPIDLTLEEVVVAANRWEQDKRLVPNKIASIRPGEITFQNPQTAADLLAITGDVFIQKSQQGGGSPMIRGFAANRVLIVVDGVRMNNAIFRSGNLQNIISLDPLVTENAEVIFGPGSVIYGSDAVGGVMDFHTLTPEVGAPGSRRLGGSVMARYSSAGQEKTTHAHLTYGQSNFGGVTSISYSDFGDLRMGSKGPEEYLRSWYAGRSNGKDTVFSNPDPLIQRTSGYRQLNLMQKLRWQPTPHWDLQYGGHYSTTTDVPRYDRLIELRNGVPRSAEWYYGPQTWMMHNLQLRHQRETALFDQIRLTTAYQYLEESRHDRSFNRSAVRHRTEQVDVITVNIDADKKLTERQSLFYGVEWMWNGLRSTAYQENVNSGAISPLSTRYPDGSRMRFGAAYTNYRNELQEALTLQAGLRYTITGLDATIDTSFFPFPFVDANLSNGALNGSLGIVWRPSENWQWNTNLSTGFRAPNIDDVGKIFDSEPGSVIIANPDLRPEYAYSAELGLAYAGNNRVKIELTTFYTELRQAMVRRPFTLDGQDSILYDGVPSQVLSIQNAARAFVYGIQASAQTKWGKGWSMRGQINWQRGREQDDENDTYVPLRHAAPAYGLVQLQYARQGWRFSLQYLFNAEIPFADLAPSEQEKPAIYAQDDAGNPYSPRWYTLTARGSYLLSTQWQFTLALENITDQRYRPYSSGIAGPGRNLVLSATYRLP